MLLGLSLAFFFCQTLHLVYVVSSKASPYIVNTIVELSLRRGKRPSSCTISSSMSDRGALLGSENQTGGRLERKVDLVSGTRLPLRYPQGSNPGLGVTCRLSCSSCPCSTMKLYYTRLYPSDNVQLLTNCNTVWYHFYWSIFFYSSLKGRDDETWFSSTNMTVFCYWSLNVE